MGTGCTKAQVDEPLEAGDDSPAQPYQIKAPTEPVCSEEGASAANQPALWTLPSEVMHLILGHLELKDRICLLTANKSLRALEASLPLLDLEVTLANLRQARGWAAWLAKHNASLRSLAMRLPHPDAWVEDSWSIQRAPWLWDALSTSPTLESLAWDALACERPFYAQPDVGFTYRPACLPALRRLEVRAPLVRLPASFTQLSALRDLSLVGYHLRLEAGCLPALLQRLAVHWRCPLGFGASAAMPSPIDPRRGDATQPADLAAAAAAPAAITHLRLEQSGPVGGLGLHGLGCFPGLLSLRLAGRLLAPGSPELGLAELAALSQLRELEVVGTSGDGGGNMGAEPSRLDGLVGIEALPQLSRLVLSDVEVETAGPGFAAAIWQLPAVEDLTLTGVTHRGLPLPVLSPADAALEWRPPQQLTRLALDATTATFADSAEAITQMESLEELSLVQCAAAPAAGVLAGVLGSVAAGALPQLQGLEVHPQAAAAEQGEGVGLVRAHSVGQVWPPEVVCAEVDALRRARPELQLAFCGKRRSPLAGPYDCSI